MKNNKFKILVILVLLISSVVGVTLAYFISKDRAVETFRLETTGIAIKEGFGSKSVNTVKPGELINKNVELKNLAEYDQLVRVKISAYFTDDKGNKLDQFDPKYIKLNFVEKNLTTEDALEDNKWVKVDDYYYYLGKLNNSDKMGASTNQLLQTVTIDRSIIDAGMNPDGSYIPNAKYYRDYHDKRYDVIVDAEGVQADSNAFTDAWAIKIDSKLGKKLAGLQNK